MTRKVLNVTALAALASGVALQASATPAPVATAPVVAPVATSDPAPAAAVEGSAPADTAAPAPAAAAPAPSVVATPGADVTAYLQGQINTKDAALLTANVEIAGLKAKLADFEATRAGLVQIAATSLTNMRVAMGGNKTDLSALTATELLAQHAAATTDFEKTFVAGGVAAVDAAQETKASAAPVTDSLTVARLQAVNASKRPR